MPEFRTTHAIPGVVFNNSSEIDDIVIETTSLGIVMANVEFFDTGNANMSGADILCGVASNGGFTPAIISVSAGDVSASGSVITLSNVANGAGTIVFRDLGSLLRLRFEPSVFPASGSVLAQVKFTFSWKAV